MGRLQTTQMDAPKIRNTKDGPERAIQDRIIRFLELRQWLVMETHGNMFSRGWPDLYCTHKIHGPRWVEVKNGDAYSFTPAQLNYFPKLCAHGAGVWIMIEASEHEYQKLFRGPNWSYYLHCLNMRAHVR